MNPRRHPMLSHLDKHDAAVAQRSLAKQISVQDEIMPMLMTLTPAENVGLLGSILCDLAIKLGVAKESFLATMGAQFDKRQEKAKEKQT